MALSPSDLARQLAALRKRTAKSCPECGRSFGGLRQQVYCSHTCRSRAAMRAMRARQRADEITRDPRQH